MDLLTPAFAGTICMVAVSWVVNPGMVAHFCFAFFAFYLLARHISRSVQRRATGLDAAVISTVSAIVHIAEMHSLLRNCRAANKFLPTIDIVYLATRSILNVMAGFF